MKTIDEHDRRAFASEKNRHQAKVEQLAAHIAEYAGYLLRDVLNGRGGEQFASGIESDIAELRRRQTALDALNNVEHILGDA